jgi:arylsulfatase A-like enzyme
MLILTGYSCKRNGTGIPPQLFSSPNILWLVAEDLSPTIPPFGDSTIQTPNLSRLAGEGVRYTNVFSVSGVCSPSRAALATGMYPSSIGAHHMRTLFQQPAAREKGIINYEVVPPPYVKMVSQIMRENGYYCSNNSKEDYQFHPSKMAWDESSVYAHWRNGPRDKPFFSIFNFGVTHESNTWNPFGRTYDLDTFPPPRNMEKWWLRFQNVKKPLYVAEDLEVRIPPYLPATEAVVNDVRRMYSNIVELDRHVGVILNQLEEDGLLENTIIVWYTDHGGPLPRQKRLLYDSGLKVPLIIRYPGKWRAGEMDDRLISFVDFAPTLLSMAGIEVPDYMQGYAFEGKSRAAEERKYIHAAGDRFDEYYDMIRAVRDKRYKYLKNFQPEKGYYLPLEYRERMATMQELLRLREEGKLNEIQMQWFRPSKPEEELFDTENDPHELQNLAGDPAYADKLSELRAECERWMEEIKDMGFAPEEDIIMQFWPDKQQPGTAPPEVIEHDGKIQIACATEGATIGYKFPADEAPGLGWRIYQGPVEVPSGESIKIIAHRIGYAPSDTVLVKSEF